MTTPPTPPVVSIAVGTTGATPTPPLTIRTNLLTYLGQSNPGLTANLPGLLIEDILSTEIASIYQCDSAAVGAVNSLTPNDANAWLLYLLGQIYGVAPGADANTNVYVVFSATDADDNPVAGAIIPQGYIVGDGTYQYVIQDGGVTITGGSSEPLFAVANQAGAWAVGANTVTSILSSQPGTITFTVTNPEPGTASPGPETVSTYRGRVLTAGLASATGMGRLLKTALGNVPGVQTRLISVVQADSGWEIICGGGDPYAIAGAIYDSLFDISTLLGSTLNITAITNANPGVVTTDKEHGLITGQTNVHIAGVVGMTGVNGGPYTVTVVNKTKFSFGVDTTSAGSWVSGGVVTPNARNQSISIIDYPNTYTILFVVPPPQVVQIGLVWITDSPNFVAATAIQQAGVGPIANYINSIYTGQPINLLSANAAFLAAISSIIDPGFISGLTWTVTIDGTVVTPLAGTQLIFPDPEAYLTCVASAVTITQGSEP